MTIEHITVPMQTRLAPMQGIDTETRTVDVTWSVGGSRVRRRDFFTGRPYQEELSLDDGDVDLARLNSGAPLLNSHNRDSLSDQIGVVERAWVERDSSGVRARATVRFSTRADVEPIWQDVQNGIIRNVSVGYVVRSFDVVDDPEHPDLPIWRAVDWQPLELSAVTIGADPGAGFREHAGEFACRLIHRATAQTERSLSMTEEVRAVESEAAKDVAKEDVVSRAEPEVAERTVEPAMAADAVPAVDLVAGERARISGIYDAARKLGVTGDAVDTLVRDGVELGEARAALINLKAEKDSQVETRSYVRAGGLDARETMRAAVESALLHRFNPGVYTLTDAAREWRGMNLMEMARSVLDAQGERTRGLSRDEIASRALHTTSDFPNILANVAGKTLRAAYEAYPRTFLDVARRVSVPDFKEVSRTQLGEAPQLEVVNEAGEFKRGTIAEGKESYAVATYGKVVGVTRKVLINDDMDAFTRIPALFGTAAATLESDTVWGIVTANAAMSDGVALFHANHGNLAGTGTALDVANLGKARAAMAKQTGLDAKTVLNIRPAYLVVPVALLTAAEQLVAQNLVPAAASNVVPQSLRSLMVVADPRLDPSSGAVPWYLFASPATIDTIEYAYLEGNDGVQLETRNGFDVDGIEIKARLDFGAKAIDWRGIYKNPGVTL